MIRRLYVRPWYAVLAVWLALAVVLAANVAHYAPVLLP